MIYLQVIPVIGVLFNPAVLTRIKGPVLVSDIRPTGALKGVQSKKQYPFFMGFGSKSET